MAVWPLAARAQKRMRRMANAATFERQIRA
jgi:hypothetical protein